LSDFALLLLPKPGRSGVITLKKSLKKFRNRVIYEINKNNFTKNIFYNIADKGFKF